MHAFLTAAQINLKTSFLSKKWKYNLSVEAFTVNSVYHTTADDVITIAVRC